LRSAALIRSAIRRARELTRIETRASGAYAATDSLRISSSPKALPNPS
jgi:hypothetical protein